MSRLYLALAAAVAVAGCSHDKPHVASPTVPPPTATATAAPPPTQAAVKVSPNLAVGSDLAKKCALRFNSEPQAPKFDFDRFELLAEDRDVLDQVASCLTSGPLRGRTVQLVGRADPRGTEEYNLALGSRRAESVLEYLQRLGVSQSQLSHTTRGALDAQGTDDASWREDRRVDLRLASR